MKEMAISLWCDFCWNDNPTPSGRTEASVHVMAAIVIEQQGRPILRELDLCEPHGKTMAELAAVVEKMGIPLGERDQKALAAQTAGTTRAAQLLLPSGNVRQDPECLVCGRVMSRTALLNHMWRDHIQLPRPQSPEECPECGVSFRDSEKPGSSMGRHRLGAHGHDSLAEAESIWQQSNRPRGKR